jgi:hypothetical protein
MPDAVLDEHYTRTNLMQIERRKIKVLPCAGIGGEKYLETAIQEESIGAMVGPHPTADMISGFEHPNFLSGLYQHLCTGEPGHPRANNQDHLSPLTFSLPTPAIAAAA